MLVNSTDMKKDKIKKRKLYKRGGRITYYNMGGMYGNNTVPTSMINPGPQASYEQVNQAQINAGQNQLAQIQANPWQQQFQEQQAQRDQTNQMLNQSLSQGTSQLQNLATQRFEEGKTMFGMDQAGITEAQYGDNSMHSRIFGEQSAQNYAAGDGMTAGQANLYGQAANLVGQGITAVSDDDDATTMNVGETSGTVLSGMGKGAATGATIGSIIPGVGTAIGAGVGAVVGGISSGLKGKKARDEAREMEAEEEARRAQAQQAMFAGNLTGKEYTGSDMGTLRTGGRPGLWANIHAKRKRIKAGSGEKMRKPGSKGAPTDAALKRSQNKAGGYRNFYMGGGPLKYANGGENSNPLIDGTISATNPNVIMPNINSGGNLTKEELAKLDDWRVNSPAFSHAHRVGTEIIFRDKDNKAIPKNKEDMSHLQKVANQDNWWQRGKYNPLGYINAYDDVETRLGAVADGMDVIAAVPIPVASQIAGAFGGAARIGEGVAAGDQSIIGQGIANTGISSIPGANTLKAPGQFLAKHALKTGTKKTIPKIKETFSENPISVIPNPIMQREGGVRKFVGGGYDFSRTPDGKKVEVGGPVDPNDARLALDVAGMFNPVAGFAAGVLDANDARKYFQAGDYKSALKSAGMAGLGFIPWGGSWVKGGIKGVSKLAKTPIKPLVNTGSSLKVATSGGKTLTKGSLKTDKHIANNQTPLVVPPSGPSQAGPVMDPNNTMMLGYRHGGTKQLDGGVAKSLPGGATEFIGKKHEQGGIKLDPMTEVEGGETMDKVQGSDYFFSSYLKLGGKSFAQRHKDILKKGGSQQDIERLAAIQEKAAGRDKYDLGGERKKFENGGTNSLTEKEQKMLQDYLKTLDSNNNVNNSTSLEIPAALKNVDPALFNLEGFSIADLKDSADVLGLSLLEAANFMLTPEGYSFIKGIPTNEASIIINNAKFATENPSKNENIINNATNANFVEDKNEKKNKNNNKSNTGILYNKVTDADIADYLDEAAAITGLETFDPRNKEHVRLLQTNLMNPSEELRNSNPTFFSGKETDILEGDLGKNKQGVDGKFGIDTLNALREFSELQDSDPFEVLPGSYDPNIYQFNPNLAPVIDEDPNDEYQWTGEFEPEESLTAEEENTKKRSGFLKGLGDLGIPLLGAGLQLLPAYMAFKEKPDYMAEPGRIPETHLDRVRFNAEREQNEGNYRGMGRMIEQAGMGPAGIAAKMASWGKKQAQDVQIGSAEARQNAQIQNQEASINSQNTRQNIANRMSVDEFNRAADAATKDRKLMAVQNAVQSIAGMGADYLQYKAQDDLSRAIAGQTNVLDNFYTHELDFQRLNPGMEDKKGTPEYSNAFAGYLKKLSNNTNQREGGYRSLYGRGGRKMLKKC